MLEAIKKNLIDHLKGCLPEHQFQEVLHYAVLPPGKLFRPQLVLALAQDLNKSTPGHQLLASSIELHHAYTLIHDDLPAMDDDDFRRGKKATHKQFSEWEAILAGDALLNYSYQLLSDIDPSFLPKLLSLYGKCTGAQGLILGQVMDLEQKEKSLQDIILIHSLKTSCLIQLAIQGSNLLASGPLPEKQMMALGHAVGIVFQLLDDMTELTETVTEHEKEINPFIKFDPNKVMHILTDQLTQIHEITCEYNLINLKQVIDSYLIAMKEKIQNGQQEIEKTIPDIEMIYTLL